jgi:hypothetical protein
MFDGEERCRRGQTGPGKGYPAQGGVTLGPEQG